MMIELLFYVSKFFPFRSDLLTKIYLNDPELN